MNHKYIRSIVYLNIFLLVMGLYSCKKMFDVTPEEVLVSETNYQNINDANEAILGIYGQLYNIANQYIILNELRGDLLDITENSDMYLNEISTHNVSSGNPYADPAPFYAIINNCNDVLKHLFIMRDEKRLKDAEFNERYSDVMSIRCWLYLQLGIHFNAVPYITTPFEKVEDIKAYSEYPKYQLSVLVDTLVATMEKLPVLNPYTTFTAVFDGYNMGTSGSWIERRFLLAELYLWANKYYEAATLYRTIMEPLMTGIDINNYHRLAGLNNYSAGYNYNTIYTNSSGRNFLDENVWILFFDGRFKQNNTFVDLFAADGGKYLLKPSVLSIDNWRAFPSGPEVDMRGQNVAWTLQSGKPVVYKSIMEYNSLWPPYKPGRWWIWRQESLHLHFAECANRYNHSYLAWVLVNNGMASYKTNQRNYYNSSYKRTNEPFPFDFSGIGTGTDSTNRKTVEGYYVDVGLFLRNAGIRGRARMNNIAIDSTVTDSTIVVEKMILDESAFELAYEGHRWPDLLRIALRENDPSVLADRVYQKFLRANNPQAEAVRTRLMDTNNWYLPFPEK